MLRYCN